MIGEFSALASALIISVSSVISKYLTGRIAALPLQTMRSWFGGISLIVVCFILGRVTQLNQVTLLLLGMMIGSAFVGVVLGDTLYMKAMSLTEVSRVFPIVRSAQILSSMLIAGLFLGEEVTWTLAVGAILIIGGIYLAAFAKTEVKPNPGAKPVKRMTWLLLSMAVGMCWAMSLCLMKVVMRDVEPLLASAIKFVFAPPMLTLLVLGSGQGQSLRIIKHGQATLWLVIVCGILSYGVGGLLSMYAVHLAGVSKSAILTSTSPLFVLGLSILFLKEKLTLRLGLGTLLCIGGIALLVIL